MSDRTPNRASRLKENCRGAAGDTCEQFANLEIAKQQWEVTFDSIADPIFICDENQLIVRANKAYRDAAGVSFVEMIGKPHHQVFPLLKTAGPGAPAARTADEISVPVLKKIYQRRTFPVTATDGRQRNTIHVLVDITDLKQANDKIRQEMQLTTDLIDIAESATRILDLDALAGHLVQRVRRILGSESALFYTWEQERRILRPVRQCGLDAAETPLFFKEPLCDDRGFVKAAMRLKHPLALHLDAGRREQHRIPGCLQRMETVIVIPFLGRERRLGLMICSYRALREPTTRSRRLVEGIAREVSLALDEAYSYRVALERSADLTRKIETLQIIHEIDRSILSTLMPDEAIATAVRNVSRVIPCEGANLMLADHARGVFVCTADGSFGDQADVPLGETNALEVVAAGRPQYLSSITEIEEAPPWERALRQRGIASLVRVPVIARGEPVGALGVYGKRQAAFSPDNLTTLEQLAAVIGVELEHSRLLADMQELFIGTVMSLSCAIDAKSAWTAGHSERVTRYSLLIGKRLGLSEPELRDLEFAGLLHDVGKIGIRDGILNKKLALTADEFESIKKHPLHGAEMLRPIKQLTQVIHAVRHHHERYDGSGYPGGLKGEQIPYHARILAVADAFDSMTGWRPYRKTFDTSEAVEELRRCAGTQFDPDLAEHFIGVVNEGMTVSL